MCIGAWASTGMRLALQPPQHSRCKAFDRGARSLPTFHLRSWLMYLILGQFLLTTMLALPSLCFTCSGMLHVPGVWCCAQVSWAVCSCALRVGRQQSTPYLKTLRYHPANDALT